MRFGTGCVTIVSSAAPRPTHEVTESGDPATQNSRPERPGRARAQLGAWPGVIRPVPLDPAGLHRRDDHRGRFVESRPGLRHVNAERGVLHARQPAPHAEQRPALGEDVQHDYLLGHAERVVPGQDDRGGTQLQPLRPPGDVRQQHDVVGAHRVVVEVVLDGPQAVVAQPVGELGEPELASVHLLVGQLLVQVAEPEVDSDVRHRGSFTLPPPRTAMLGSAAAAAPSQS